MTLNTRTWKDTCFFMIAQFILCWRKIRTCSQLSYFTVLFLLSCISSYLINMVTGKETNSETFSYHNNQKHSFLNKLLKILLVIHSWASHVWLVSFWKLQFTNNNKSLHNVSTWAPKQWCLAKNEIINTFEKHFG